MLPKRAITVTLPAPHDAEVTCPICEGNKCKVCNSVGKIAFEVAPKIPIQRAHIIKYVVDLGGACWIVNRLDELSTPNYFTSRKELKKFKEGWMVE